MATTISPCGNPPTVLNGKIIVQTSDSTEYECLPGFAMTGNKVIGCTTGSTNDWNTNIPFCNIIEQTHNVYVNDYESWWLYVVAGLIGAMFILFFVWCIWCMCCATGRRFSVFPRVQSNRRSCWRCCRRKSCDCNSVHDGYYHTGTRGQTQQLYQPPTGLIDLEDGVYFVPVRPLVQNRQENRHIPKQVAENIAPETPKDEKTPRSNGFTFRNAVHDVIDDNRKQKKAKELNAWMPHRHPRRSINTSTK